MVNSQLGYFWIDDTHLMVTAENGNAMARFRFVGLSQHSSNTEPWGIWQM
jgi:hypothetical protein